MSFHALLAESIVGGGAFDDDPAGHSTVEVQDSVVYNESEAANMAAAVGRRVEIIISFSCLRCECEITSLVWMFCIRV